MPRIAASPALAHLRILDLTRVRAGPSCVRQFADFGADVIKIESPPGVDANENMGGARTGSDFQNLQRNKRSLTLNLKLPQAKEVFARLAKTADVVVENYRPDVKYRLGIDYESLAKINPRIILASISGFGQDGPYRDRPGFDQIAQGMSGLMSITGLPGQGPVRVGAAVADVTAGLFAALGIMTALLERERSGKGQWVQSSLLQAGITLTDFQAARYLKEREVAPQVGNDHPTSMPTSAYRTADGHINVAASGEGMWKRLCAAIGREDLLARPEFKDQPARAKNRKHHRIGRQDLSIRELMTRILKRLTPGEFMEFKDLFPESSTVHELVVTFLAVLELTKETLLDVTQAEPFSPIYVRLHESATE